MNIVSLINPSTQEVLGAIDTFEISARIPLHRVAKEALQLHEVDDIPIPSLVAHSGYVLGRLFFASSPHDGQSLFASLSFIAAPNHVLSVLRDPDGQSDFSGIDFTSQVMGGDSATGADAVLRFLEIAVRHLQSHVIAVRHQVSVLQSGITQLTVVKRSRAQRQLLDLWGMARVVEVELQSVVPLVEGFRTIGSLLARDILDVRDANGTEMFAPSHEALAAEIALWGEQLRIQTNVLSRAIADSMTDLQLGQNQIQQRASRFAVSLGVLAAFPYLLLNVYSQYFSEGKVWSTEFTTRYSWIVIIAAEAILMVYLYRRKWMRWN